MRALSPFIAAFLVCIPASYAAPAAKPMTICLTESTGAVIARPKCRKGEVVFNARSLASTLSGPQGPQGIQGLPGAKGEPGPKGDTGLQGPSGGAINFGACYQKIDFHNTTVGVGTLAVECNDKNTEFMLADGVSSNTAISFVNEKTIIFDATGKVPVGVKYWTVRDDLVNYTISVTIACCKR